MHDRKHSRDGSESVNVSGVIGDNFVATRSTTTRDRNLQFWGAVSTGFFWWIFSSGFCLVCPGVLCSLVSKEITPKCGENCPISGRRKRTQNPVTSLAVVVFFFFGPERKKVSSERSRDLKPCIATSLAAIHPTSQMQTEVGRGEKTPTPKISAVPRKRPVLLRANFILTKDRKRPHYGHVCGKMHRKGLAVKRQLVLSKVQMLNLVLGVGVFSLLPMRGLEKDCFFGVTLKQREGRELGP